MKKSALVTFAFVATASIANAGSYQSIRLLTSSDQFNQAVKADTVIVSLPQNLTLYRKQGEADATRKIVKVMPMYAADGSIEKELVISCEFRQKNANARRVILPKTVGKAGPWQVFSVATHSHSAQTWTLGRISSRNRVTLSCETYEKGDGERISRSLTASMVNRALSQVNGSVLTEVGPRDLDAKARNDVLTAESPAYETPVYESAAPQSAAVRSAAVAQ